MIPRSRLLRETATIIRQAGGSRNEFGEYVPGEPVRTDVSCATAPISGQDRDLDEAGLRLIGDRAFWFPPGTDLAVASQDRGDDSIEYDGQEFRVVRLERFPRSHVKAFCARVEGTQ